MTIVKKLTTMLDEKVKAAVEEYQCPGCVVGMNTACYEKGDTEACERHVAGTTVSNIGRIFLGMPTGFNRLGMCDSTRIHIFNEPKDGWGYDKFNVPVWKHLDEHGNVLVRGICPRTNYPWIHIFLKNCLSEISCIELATDELAEMD